ncbi:MAG: winged helix-turn-helix transcriptional regulator [Alphaproteobacteria bacterium]
MVQKQRSECVISCVLDLIGDKWSLLIIRDMVFNEKKRYGEFQDSPEGIPSNILADRLKKLENAGLITKKLYQQNPPRNEYLVTDAGVELKAILDSMAVWGEKHLQCEEPKIA